MSGLRTLLVALALSAVAGCGGTITPGDPDAALPDGALACPGDSDGDSILDAEEGAADPDGDGRPASADDDSDGDGIEDALEAGDRDCGTSPVDSDGDGTADFLDRDSNDDFVDDSEEWGSDLDLDGASDAVDLDPDGDTIGNADERGPGPGARDTDGDGTPDVLDLDSDGDGVDDADEAGDADPATPPIACDREVDLRGAIAPDGAPDFVDLDRDDDGLADGEELAAGTEPCGADTDADGSGDLIEIAYERAHCPDRATASECGCATSAACSPPGNALALVLAGADPTTRDLDVGITVRRADVFFATDTTASMGGTLANVRATVGEIVDRVAATIPDAWLGGGQIEDFPFSSYGGPGDRPFALAIGMTPAARAGDVRAAFDAIALHGGGDGPEAHSEALLQIFTGAGGSFAWSSATMEIPDYRADCLVGSWGAPCFRDGALPIVVLFTDTCSHDGPPDDDVGACTAYAGIAPAPATWEQAIAEMRNRGASFVGVNAAETISCATASAPDRTSPCWFLRRTAIETSSIDVEGRPLVYDLPNASDAATFADTIAGAIETVALRVRRDVDVAIRSEMAPEGIDVGSLVDAISPACSGGSGDDACWIEPAGVAHGDAVGGLEGGTFRRVLPGTRVVFSVALRNDAVPASRTSHVAWGWIDVRADGYAVIDTRELLIAIPADDGIAR